MNSYVVHHASLGSFVTVYIEDKAQVKRSMSLIQSLRGIDCVLSRSDACGVWGLPEDRVGDIVVTADESYVIGRTPKWYAAKVPAASRAFTYTHAQTQSRHGEARRARPAQPWRAL